MTFDVKNTTFSGVLDLLAPYSCRGCGRLGGLLCDCCKNYNMRQKVKICPRCKIELKECNCDVSVLGVAYREGIMVRLVEEYKYKSIRKTADILAEMLIKRLEGMIPWRETVIVPLPTIARHIRERGFDHMKLLSKKIAKQTGGAERMILVRKNKTVQVGASETQRKKQAQKAYEAQGIADREKTYLLIDDVWTTGASMEAAIEAMKRAGARKMVAAVILIPRAENNDGPAWATETETVVRKSLL